jgi:hypothetical protein
MFIDRSQRAEIEMLIPAHPRCPLPWRWMAAAVLLLVLALIASL